PGRGQERAPGIRPPSMARPRWAYGLVTPTRYTPASDRFRPRARAAGARVLALTPADGTSSSPRLRDPAPSDLLDVLVEDHREEEILGLEPIARPLRGPDVIPQEWRRAGHGEPAGLHEVERDPEIRDLLHGRLDHPPALHPPAMPPPQPVLGQPVARRD